MAAELLADFYERDELAEQIEKTTRTLDRWHAVGLGPPRVKLGNQVLYPKKGVATWLAELATAPKRRRRT